MRYAFDDDPTNLGLGRYGLNKRQQLLKATRPKSKREYTAPTMKVSNSIFKKKVANSGSKKTAKEKGTKFTNSGETFIEFGDLSLERIFDSLRILPSQWNTQDIIQNWWQMLAYRQMEEAIHTVFGKIPRYPGEIKNRENDIRWFLEGDTGAMTCSHCCRSLGMDYETFQAKIKKAIDEKVINVTYHRTHMAHDSNKVRTNNYKRKPRKGV